MKFADTLRSAAQSLRAHLTRSSLTVLGLSIGVGASIAIGSLGTAAVREVRGEMSRFGVDRVWVEGAAGARRCGGPCEPGRGQGSGGLKERFLRPCGHDGGLLWHRKSASCFRKVSDGAG